MQAFLQVQVFSLQIDSLSGLLQPGNFSFLEESPGPSFQMAQMQAPLPDPYQALYLQPCGGAHPANLAVLSLVDHHRQHTRSDLFHPVRREHLPV